MRGLCPFNRYVESWWRRATFSSCSENRDPKVGGDQRIQEEENARHGHEGAQWQRNVQWKQLTRFVGTHTSVNTSLDAFAF